MEYEKLPRLQGFTDEEWKELQKDFEHAQDLGNIFRNKDGVLEFASDRQFENFLTSLLPDSPVFLNGKRLQ